METQSTSLKRSHQDADTFTETPTQRPRLSQLNPRDVCLENLSRSGVVQKVHLKNFMCHTSMEITLNRRINFIVGRNGSGKSAILTALVVGLGGTAGTTNRGSSLKEFIKNGKSSAFIKITLNNSGPNSFKPHEYGNSIIVERTLNISGASNYKIKGLNGITQSTKREELDRIVNCFNIQVANPISVLNQDTARTFLNSSDPRKKYELFMKASQLHTLWQIMYQTLDRKRNITMMFNEKETSLSLAKKELDALQLRWNQVQAVDGYRQKILDLKNEFKWVLVADEEQRLNVLEEKRKREEALLAKLKAKLETQTELNDVKKTQLSLVEANINEVRAELIRNEELEREARGEVGRRKEAYSSKNQFLGGLKVKIKRLEGNIKTLTDQINQMQQPSGPTRAEQQMQIRDQLGRLEQQCIEMTEIMKIVTHNLSQLRNQQGNNKEDLILKRTEKAERANRVEKLQEQIVNMRSNSADKLSVYGNHMPQLVKKIDEADRQGKFEKRPVGPIGAFLELHDASWAPAIENFLSETLKSFCVHSGKDAMTLSQIMKSVLGERQRQPPIITSKFFNVVHNVDANAVQAPRGMTSLLNALIISHPVAANCLIDQREVECILLIPTSDEARRLMSERSAVPHNCKRSITKEGDQYYPDPNYRTYAGNVSALAQFLQVSMAEVIKNKEEQLEICKREKARADAALDALSHTMRENIVEINRLSQEKNELQQKLLQVASEMDALKDTDEDPNTDSRAVWLSEIEESQNLLHTLKENEGKAKEECDYVKQELDQAKERFQTLRDTARTLHNKEAPMVSKHDTLKEEIDELNRDKNYAVQKFREHEEKKKRTAILEAEQRATTENAVLVATTAHPTRINSSKSPPELNGEIQTLENAIASVEKENGNFTDVGQELVEKRKRYSDINCTVKSVKKALKLLDTVLHDRETTYLNIQRLISVQVSQLFSMMLFERKFKGEVKIDHANQVLQILVQPENRDPATSSNTKTLSGGERSYATVMFIIALWDVANAPFYFLDEFDVFMDKVNRRITLEMLATQAKANRQNQFVFLTPQDLSSIEASDEITIHKMRNPREEA